MDPDALQPVVPATDADEDASPVVTPPIVPVLSREPASSPDPSSQILQGDSPQTLVPQVPPLETANEYDPSLLTDVPTTSPEDTPSLSTIPVVQELDVHAVLESVPLAQITPAVPSTESADLVDVPPPPSHAYMRSLSRIGLAKRRKHIDTNLNRILALVAEKEHIVVSDVQLLLRISKRTAEVYLNQLVFIGHISRRGKGVATEYWWVK